MKKHTEKVNFLKIITKPPYFVEIFVCLFKKIMNVNIPALEQFTLQAVDQVSFNAVNEELRYFIEVSPDSIMNRVLVGLMDQSRRRGMAVAIYPATGEVCDLINGEGVIGYLSEAPLKVEKPIECELKLFRFGKNFVCSAVVNGETFLYPAFCCDADAPLTAFVGQQSAQPGRAVAWNGLQIELAEANGVTAAA